MDQDRLDELIDKYASGTISPGELRELLDWYRSAEIGTVEWPAETPQEKDQLKERMLLRLHTQIRATQPNPAAPADPLVIPMHAQAQAARTRSIRIRGWQVAASLILIISSIWIARQYASHTGNPAWVEVRNPTGKILTTRLPDSSLVSLNAASTIRYSSDLGKGHGGPREIYLEGEGYFQVARNPTHPFLVHAGSLTTTVLGTRFDVNAYDGGQFSFVSVLSGEVSVRDSVRVLDVLTSSRQLQLDTRTGVAKTQKIDTNQVAAWRQGKLQFSGQSMEEITASLSRWYNIHFIFANPAISRCRYYLNFDNSISLHQMLAALRETTDLNFVEDTAGHTVTISGNACN